MITTCHKLAGWFRWKFIVLIILYIWLINWRTRVKIKRYVKQKLNKIINLIDQLLYNKTKSLTKIRVTSQFFLIFCENKWLGLSGTNHRIRSISLLAHDPWYAGLKAHCHLCGPLDILRSCSGKCLLDVLIFILNLQIIN